MGFQLWVVELIWSLTRSQVSYSAFLPTVPVDKANASVGEIIRANQIVYILLVGGLLSLGDVNEAGMVNGRTLDKFGLREEDRIGAGTSFVSGL